jgi:hypothetical protein
MLTDDHLVEQTATDICVFGKWSGAEIQISDMPLQVCRYNFSTSNEHVDLLLH